MNFLLDAIKDSIILLPFLFGAYILIEFLETLTAKRFTSKALKHPAAPLVGAAFGLLPQCGFSVVATDMFTQKKITIGTIIAIYIATSDEAIPLLIASPNKILYLLPLLLIKFLYAIIIGFAVDGIVKLHSRRKTRFVSATALNHTTSTSINNIEDITTTTGEEINEDKAHTGNDSNECADDGEDTHEGHHAHNQKESMPHDHIGCCGHHIEEPAGEHWAKRYLLHPLLHTLKIFAFILVINIILSGLIEWIGEDLLTNFLASNAILSPLISCVVGLIPNCASSIVITELFIHGGLSFGATIAGLSTNAGLGFVILFKQNRNMKVNLFILLTLFLSSLLLGYIVQLIMLLF